MDFIPSMNDGGGGGGGGRDTFNNFKITCEDPVWRASSRKYLERYLGNFEIKI